MPIKQLILFLGLGTLVSCAGPRLERAEAALQNGENERARTLAEAELEVRGRDAPAYLLAAEAAAAQQNYTLAFAHLMQAKLLGADPSRVDRLEQKLGLPRVREFPDWVGRVAWPDWGLRLATVRVGTFRANARARELALDDAFHVAVHAFLGRACPDQSTQRLRLAADKLDGRPGIQFRVLREERGRDWYAALVEVTFDKAVVIEATRPTVRWVVEDPEQAEAPKSRLVRAFSDALAGAGYLVKRGPGDADLELRLSIATRTASEGDEWTAYLGRVSLELFDLRRRVVVNTFDWPLTPVITASDYGWEQLFSPVWIESRTATLLEAIQVAKVGSR